MTLTIEFDEQKYNISNEILESLKKFQNMIQIKKSVETEEFKIDTEYCLNALEEIKKGDFSNFKKTTPEELFKDLGI
jgi:hypothetical protein